MHTDRYTEHQCTHTHIGHGHIQYRLYELQLKSEDKFSYVEVENSPCPAQLNELTKVAHDSRKSFFPLHSFEFH